MTAHGTSNMAVDAIRLGAFDFLTKPFDAARLKVTLDNGTQDKMILVPFKPGLDAMIFLVLIVAPF